jgi:REP element-mobilizing transposase RayT
LIVRRSKQQELPLGLDRRRQNPGRPKGPNPRILHRSRGELDKSHPCHVTIKVRPGLPSLRDLRIVRAVERTFRRGCERADFRLVHYTLQGDHAHLVVEADDADALGRGMKSIAARFALAVNRALRRRGPVLRDRYHFRALTSPTAVRNVLRYVLLDGRKHGGAKKGAARPALDPASSARWFDGWLSTRQLDRSPPRSLGSAPAVAGATTWLLRRGWRLLGLIDPADVPGPASG